MMMACPKMRDGEFLPKNYNRAEPGSGDKQQVWSETGHTCVLITSTGNIVGS